MLYEVITESLVRIIRLLIGERMQEVFTMYLKGSEIVFMRDFLANPDLLQAALEKIGLFDEVAELFGSATTH